MPMNTTVKAYKTFRAGKAFLISKQNTEEAGAVWTFKTLPLKACQVIKLKKVF